jgi:predicted phage terminase large subunit-like protein
VTGEGGDVTVLDDPHKPEEAQSDLTRQFVLDWHDATWSTRLNDPETGVKIVVMQRLHERDLTGHLLERGGWEHLCLPAGYAPSHQFAWPRDPRTEPGEVLWEKWGRRGSPRRSSSSAPTAMPVNTSSARRRPRAGSSSGAGGATTTTRASCPTSISSASRGTWRSRTPTVPDYVVGQVWGSFGAELYLLHQLRRRLEFTDTLHAVRELTRWVTERFPHREAHAKYVEDKANGPAVIATLRREVPGLIAVDPRGDKVARARAVAPALEAGNVYLPGRPSADGSDYDRAHTPDWVQAFIEECAAFPNRAHDDQVDAFSQALMKLLPGAVVRRPRSRAPRRVGGLRTKQL